MKLNIKWWLIGVSLLVILAACSDTNTVAPEVDPTVVNGENAQAHEFPFMAALWRTTSPGTFFCGASLLSDEWIITAAHCVESGQDFIVVAGDHTRSSIDGLEQGRRAQRVIIHPEYGGNFIPENDIALIQLGTPFDLTDEIEPIAYASSLPPANTQVQVSGWGLTSGGGSLANILQKANITLRSQQDCADSDGGTFCAIDARPVTDACNGDSGGPVFEEGELIGLVSYGPRACDSRGFYTNVPFFSDWIESQTGISQSF